MNIILSSAVLVFVLGCASNNYYQTTSPQIEATPVQIKQWKSSKYNKLKEQEEITIILPVYSSGYEDGQLTMYVNLTGDKADIWYFEIYQVTIPGHSKKSWNNFKKIQIGNNVYDKSAENFSARMSSGYSVHLKWGGSKNKVILNEICSNTFDGTIKLIGEYDDVIITIDKTHFDYICELNSKYNP